MAQLFEEVASDSFTTTPRNRPPQPQTPLTREKTTQGHRGILHLKWRMKSELNDFLEFVQYIYLVRSETELEWVLKTKDYSTFVIFLNAFISFSTSFFLSVFHEGINYENIDIYSTKKNIFILIWNTKSYYVVLWFPKWVISLTRGPRIGPIG